MTVDDIQKSLPISSRDPKAMISEAQANLITAYWMGASSGDKAVMTRSLQHARAYIDAAIAAGEARK